MRWRPSLEQVVVGATAAALFPVVHLFNAWAFQFVEFSSHINLIYLPAFYAWPMCWFWGSPGAR